MRRLLFLLSGAFLLLGIFVVAALLIGRAQPTPPRVAMLHLTDCELPCWIGIMPGKTTIQEAQSIVKNTYGDSAIFSISEFGDNDMDIVSKSDNTHLTMSFIASPSGYATAADPPVELINLGVAPLRLSDFISVFRFPSDMMVYEGNLQANFGDNITLYNLSLNVTCPTVLPDSELQDLQLSAKWPYPELGIELRRKWRGFRTCYK